MTHNPNSSKALHILGAALALGTSLGMVSQATAATDPVDNKTAPGTQKTIKGALPSGAMKLDSKTIKMDSSTAQKVDGASKGVKMSGWVNQKVDGGQAKTQDVGKLVAMKMPTNQSLKVQSSVKVDGAEASKLSGGALNQKVQQTIKLKGGATTQKVQPDANLKGAVTIKGETPH